MIHKGMTRVISTSFTSTGAGAMSVPLRPADGKQWEIIYAVGYHADAAAVICDWTFVDPDSGGAVGLSGMGISLNPAVQQPLGGIVAGALTSFVLPLKATRGRYPAFVFVASAINKIGYIRAVVIEYGGTLDA